MGSVPAWLVPGGMSLGRLLNCPQDLSFLICKIITMTFSHSKMRWGMHTLGAQPGYCYHHCRVLGKKTWLLVQSTHTPTLPPPRWWGPKSWPAHQPWEKALQATDSTPDSSGWRRNSCVEPTRTSLALLTMEARFTMTLRHHQPLPMTVPQRQNTLPYPFLLPSLAHLLSFSSGTRLESSDRMVTSLLVNAPLFFFSYTSGHVGS